MSEPDKTSRRQRPRVMLHRGKEIKISRQPLGKGQAHFFEDGTTLLDRVGLALCELNYFPRKELFESQAFARKAQRRINQLDKGPRWTLLDVGGGHGLTSLFLAAYTKVHRVEACWVIDPKPPARGDELFGCFEQLIPGVLQRVERKNHFFADWVSLIDEDEELRERNYFWMGCHACGELSDAVLEVAISRREPFVLMPCCPNRRIKRSWPEKIPRILPGDFSGYGDVGLGIDLMRLGRAQASRYRVMFREIDPLITPHNRLLIGEPEEF